MPDARSTESKTPPSNSKRRNEALFSDEEQFLESYKQTTRRTNPDILTDEFPLSYQPVESLSSRPGYYSTMQNSSLSKPAQKTPEYQRNYFSNESHFTPKNLTSKFDQESQTQNNKTPIKKSTVSSPFSQDKTSPSYYTSLLNSNTNSKIGSNVITQAKPNYGSDYQFLKGFDNDALERTTSQNNFHKTDITKPYVASYMSALTNKNDFNKPILYYCGVLEDDSNGSDEDFHQTSEQLLPKRIAPPLRTEPVEKTSESNPNWYIKKYPTQHGTPKREIYNPSQMQLNIKCQSNSTLSDDSHIDTWIDKYPVMPKVKLHYLFSCLIKYQLRMPSPQHMTNYSYLNTNIPQKSARERPRIFAETRKVKFNSINFQFADLILI